MSFLQNLFSNDKVKNMAFGMLKNTMIENKIKFVVVNLTETQEIDTQMYPEEMQPVIMSKTQMAEIERILTEVTNKKDQMEQIMLEQEQTILGQNDVIGQLTEQVGKLTAENEALYNANSVVPESPAPGNGLTAQAVYDNPLKQSNGSTTEAEG